MPEVVNVTNLRGELLNTVDKISRTGKIIITKDANPVAVLLDIKEYEKKYFPDTARLPALMVLGARKCLNSTAFETIKTINAVCKKHYSKVIYVYSNATKKYLSNFKSADLRAVYNKKNNLPIITSLKCGITALSPSDRYFIVVFLSQPQDKKTLILMSKTVVKNGDKIVILRKNKYPVHPIAFSVKYKTVLIKTRKELGIPHIIKKFKNKIRYVDI